MLNPLDYEPQFPHPFPSVMPDISDIPPEDYDDEEDEY